MNFLRKDGICAIIIGKQFDTGGESYEIRLETVQHEIMDLL